MPDSAGILLYRRRDGELNVLLVHPGGPFWARREFAEELGSPAPEDPEPLDLGEITQRAGKRVRAWALEGDLDASAIVSNTCEVQWPPRSGRMIEIPEVDRAEWLSLAQARVKINPAQVALLDRLQAALA